MQHILLDMLTLEHILFLLLHLLNSIRHWIYLKMCEDWNKLLEAVNIMSSKEVVDEVNVSLLSFFLRGSFLGIISIPFGFSFEVKHARSGSRVVSSRSLFEKSVEFKFLIIREWVDFSGFGSDKFSLFVEFLQYRVK